MSQKFQESVKLFLFALLAICLLCAFIGCSSDDEEIITREITLYPGWNLVSFPVDFGVKSKLEVVPDTMQYAYIYNASNRRYETVEYIQGGTGYWIYSNDTLTFDIEGEWIDSLSIHIFSGWNLVPTLTTTIEIDLLRSIESIISPIYYYVERDSYGAYLTENGSFKLGKAYWLESRSEGILTMTEDTVIFEEINTPDSLDVPMSPPAFIFE